MTSQKKALRATVAALSVGAMTVLSTPGFAMAVTPGTTTVTAGQNDNEGTPALADGLHQPNLLKAPKDSGLVIHKLTPPTTGGPFKNNGTEVTSVGDAQGIEGVTFTLYKVDGFDLLTDKGLRDASEALDVWKALSRKDKDSATSITVNGEPHALTEWGSGTTGPNGQLSQYTLAAAGKKKVGRVPAGLYVVRESITGDTVKVNSKPVSAGSIVKAGPFVVALPLTDPDARDGWLDVVNVYPKNSQTGVKKSVTNADTPGTGNTGDNLASSTVTYSIAGDVPKGYISPKTPVNEQVGKTRLRNFQLIDKFDPKVNYKSTVSVKLTGGTKAEETLDASEYSLSFVGNNDAAAYADGNTHTPLAVLTLNDDGLEKAANHGAGTQVVWDLQAVFAAQTDSANIPNEAVVIPDFPNVPGTDYDGSKPFNPQNPNPKVPGNPPSAKVISKYGKVKIHKFEKGQEDSKPLAGAEFKLYVCDKNKKVTSGPVFVNGTDTFTTKKDGTAEIADLRANDWKNGSSAETGYIQPDDRDFYCLQETKAPEGYALDKQYIQFQILSGEDKDTAAAPVDIKVPNVKKNLGFNLPLTGGKGVFPLIALGGLLVVGSAGYAAAAARRNRNQA